MNGDALADIEMKADGLLDLESISMQIAGETPVEASSSDDTSDSPKQVLNLQGKELTSDKRAPKDMENVSSAFGTLKITVNTLDGKSLEVAVDPTKALSDILRQLEDESGVPTKNQQLFANEVADNHSAIKIFVETPDGTKHTLEVSPSDTSNLLKEQVSRETGMVVSRQVLKFLGEELPLIGTTLKDMGIRDGSELTVDVVKVPITVNNMDGNCITVMVDPTEALCDIKRHLEDETGVPAENQRLFMNGDELTDDKKTSADYGIQRGSVLDLEPKSMQITVETPEGTKHTMEVKPSDTSDSLKQHIAKETGLAVPRQVLKFQGKELPKGGRTLKDMGVREGSALMAEIYRIPITVHTGDGRTVSLDVEPSDTIDNIKKMIQKETGFEPKSQCLRFGDDELENGGITSNECGITAGSTLTLEQVADVIIFVDIKCGTLFGVERHEVIEKQVLTPCQNNKLDFMEAVTGTAAREKILQTMKGSCSLGVATHMVIEKVEVEDLGLEEAKAVENKWGVKLKKREKNKKGEEFIFVDPKTGATGELSRKKCIDMNFITPVTTEKDETLEEHENDIQMYDKFIVDIRNVFGIRFE